MAPYEPETAERRATGEMQPVQQTGALSGWIKAGLSMLAAATVAGVVTYATVQEHERRLMQVESLQLQDGRDLTALGTAVQGLTKSVDTLNKNLGKLVDRNEESHIEMWRAIERRRP